MRLDRLITLNIVRPLRRALHSLAPSDGERVRVRGESDSSLVTRHSSLPILMYHSISDDPETGVHPYYRVCTSPKRFHEQMQWLKANGYHGVSLKDGLAWLNSSAPSSPPRLGPSPAGAGEGGRRPGEGREEINQSLGRGQGKLPLSVPVSTFNFQLSAFECSSLRTSESEFENRKSKIGNPKLVALTFDDGFHDFYSTAFPILQEFGFTATMYLPTAFIGETPRPSDGRGIKGEGNSALRTPHSAFKDKEFLSWDQVRQLHSAGIEFGSHTVAHPVLYDLSWSEIECELRASKSEIEAHLGAAVTAFAYPYAFPQADRRFTSAFRDLLQRAGYDNCVTTEIGRVRAADNLFELSRLPVNSEDDDALLGAKLSGHYDWLAWPQAAVKRIKHAVRPARKRTSVLGNASSVVRGLLFPLSAFCFPLLKE